ncbi:MAG: hypothetical protein K0Q66_877 [Chitinophagaceae bacterium]|jgi:hypothetical protein|nr:hypothetical protein [Chitinophagaceae bacterium]
MKRTLFLSLALFLVSLFTYAQDTLPKFTVKDLGKNRIQVSWINPFETVVQLNVQRSFDSLRNFRTIFSPQSPSLPQNGFVDTKAPAGVKMYYRIYYVFSGGTYFFTAAKTAATGVEMPGVELSGQLITIRLRDAVIGQFNTEQYKRFRDSIMYQTKDTLYAVSPTEIVIRPYVGKEMWRASQYIFSGRDGFVNIKLPFANTKHYKVLFFEEDGTPLFEISKVKEPSLILDKANFIHSGWFLFDLYEDGVLKERNRFYVSRDF